MHWEFFSTLSGRLTGKDKIMVNPLPHLENLAERLVEGTIARMLGAQVQPLEVARRIARAMEDGQVINPQGEIVVPNEYHVALHPKDLSAMNRFQDALETELTQYISNLARQAGATMVGRPRVTIAANPATPLKHVRVTAQVVSARHGAIDVTHTQEMPAVAALARDIPAFVLYDGYRRMPINEAIVTIGRSLDNEIILDDKRVSRQHAQLRRRYDQYVLYDLDSTGGTTVNGLRVREAVLQPGDVLAFAGVKIRFEHTATPFVPKEELASGATRILPPRGTHK